jgi:4-amino-4-deoxy-L-arabinose transferase-like glycosyltransferase
MGQHLHIRLSKRLEGVIILLAVAGILALPRVLALGRFVTADEPIWGKRSAIFYYALSNKDYAATYQVAHPGVITMWAGAAAYWIKFPTYKEVGLEELGDTKLFQIFQRHGPNPLEVLATARLIVVLIIVLTLTIGFILTRKLFGGMMAICGFILIAFDPFFLAHSRLLHVDALLSGFMLVSLLAFLSYLRDRKPIALILSGIFCVLSLLTKTPGIVLVPVIGLLALIDWWMKSSVNENKRFILGLKRVGWSLIVWGAAAVVIFFVLWPSMWTNPVGTLSRMAQYSMESAQGEVGGAQFVPAFVEESQTGGNYLNFYPLTYLWRSTPVILLGLVFALALFIAKKNLVIDKGNSFWLFGMLLLVVAFLSLLSMSSKKFDRYFLPGYLLLDLIAGMGWVALGKWIVGKIPLERKNAFLGLFLGVVCVVQIVGTMQHYPYYLSYYNPLMGGDKEAPGTMMIGWGEGLNQAALYLKEIPDIQDKRVISWYSLAFNWYSLSLGFEADSIPFEVQDEASYQHDLADIDYAVVYANQWQRQLPKQMFDFLGDRKPIESIWINGLEYVRIYQLGSQ